MEGLQRRIAPHLLRRVKEDVAKDIPPKEETIIDVELTTMQKQYYRLTSAGSSSLSSWNKIISIIQMHLSRL